MLSAKIAGLGYYVPENKVSNHDLEKVMETNHDWIVERSGIEERRYGSRHKETTSSMAVEASKMAIANAGIDTMDIDLIIFATLSPDYFFPGCGVLLQRALGLHQKAIGALDIRNQCTGFVYGLSVADQFIRSGMYKNILLVGSEMHSMGLNFSTAGRDVAVLFGDGAGAAILSPEEGEAGVLSSHLHSDGTFAEELAMINPGSHGGYHDDKDKYGYDPDAPYGETFLTQKMIDDGMYYPNMNGQLVFKNAVQRFPEVIMEALQTHQLQPSDIDLLVPHQANLRIAQFVQKRLGLKNEQVYNNIQRYGNTTAASIPIALTEAWQEGKVKEGDLICLAAFGSGFTWASALLRW